MARFRWLGVSGLREKRFLWRRLDLDCWLAGPSVVKLSLDGNSLCYVQTTEPPTQCPMDPGEQDGTIFVSLF
jgi:hypothetical protein